MVTIKQLRALLAVAETGAFTAAARELSVTQSAVSVMIRELESLVGEPLVVRGRTVRLTPAGEALRTTAARTVADLGRTLDGIRSGRLLPGGRLRVAVAPMSAATFFPQALALFRERHPQVTVELLDLPVEAASVQLAAGEADVAVGPMGNNPALAAAVCTEVLVKDRLYAVYMAGAAPGAAASRERLPWGALQSAQVILAGRVGGQWRDFLRQFSDAGITLDVVHEVRLYSTVLQMVRCGLGMSLLPAFAARHLDPAHYDVRAIQQGPALWEVHWMTPRGTRVTPALQALKRATLEALGTSAAQTWIR